MSEQSKAVAGGITGLVIALLAHYGFNASPPAVTVIGAIATAVVGYVVGHLAVYFAPANKTVV